MAAATGTVQTFKGNGTTTGITVNNDGDGEWIIRYTEKSGPNAQVTSIDVGATTVNEADNDLHDDNGDHLYTFSGSSATGSISMDVNLSTNRGWTIIFIPLTDQQSLGTHSSVTGTGTSQSADEASDAEDIVVDGMFINADEAITADGENTEQAEVAADQGVGSTVRTAMSEADVTDGTATMSWSWTSSVAFIHHRVNVNGTAAGGLSIPVAMHNYRRRRVG